jgi:hypothetical protein
VIARAASWLALCGIATVLLAAPAAAALSAEQRSTILDEAQSAYDRGVRELPEGGPRARDSFRAAALRYRQLVDDGVVNGAILYNLGNAELQAGALGRAILAYRRAERFMPGDDRLAHNLAHARSLRATSVDASGGRAIAKALLAWHAGTTTRARLHAVAAVYALAWILLFAALARPAPWLRGTAGVLLLVALPLGMSVGADLFTDAPAIGVVVAAQTAARKGPGAGFEPQFVEPLPEGTEFDVVARQGDWLEIELPDAKTAWIVASDAEVAHDRAAASR